MGRAPFFLSMTGSEEWHGPAFLNEVWDLAWKKAEAEIGYKPESSKRVTT